MNVLYGVCGDGMGHITRSVVVGSHLRGLGHTVLYASSGKGLEFLRRRDEAVLPLLGLDQVVADNRLAPLQTVMLNFARQRDGLEQHVTQAVSFMAFSPDVVITDWEPWTSSFALLTGRPLLAVDNVHFVSRCAHPRHMIQNHYRAWTMMRSATNWLVPKADRYIVTTFVGAPVVAPNTELHLPILRPEIIAAKKTVTTGDHVVAYFNGKADHEGILAALRQCGVPVRLYGRPNQKQQTVVDSVTLCPFSETQWIADMASSRAVIGTSGFGLMGEALYLGKPMLALPFGDQFEQLLNAEYVEWLGYGGHAREITPEALAQFLSIVPSCAERLKRYRHDDNAGLLSAVQAAIGA